MNACLRECVRACVHECKRACLCECMRARVRVSNVLLRLCFSHFL